MAGRIQTGYMKTPFGELILGSFNAKLCLCDWRYRKMRATVDKRIKAALQANYAEEDSAIVEETKSQLGQYFNRERTRFDLPLLMVGTDFQKRVWQSLLEIPYGKSDTYAGLSGRLGNEKAIRAVAAANGANALAIIVPCHRILGSDGRMTGYAGGLETKKRLLKLEKALPQGELF